ncbi:hypothetical protein FHU41_002752 [Psychromicrobium silvestre]|uniref:Uncharacterized protein n=1 Tax=Psychromicrobium silvestre TaxID=1645614 RepID=A0A7Y9S9P8_9MICC|nr:hypothetical protein [Psychromicrobium silvestre]NYE96502.1 hypothetical protein [Psychromicrobium silvestre]
MESNGGTDPARPFNGTRPTKVVKQATYDTIEDIVKHSGAKFPTWNRADPPGLTFNSCEAGSQKGTSYYLWLEGSAITDPKASTKSMEAHWESQGYKIGNIFDETDKPSPGIDMYATTAEGAEVSFSPGTNGSSITIKSECTLDPTADDRPSPSTNPTP